MGQWIPSSKVHRILNMALLSHVISVIRFNGIDCHERCADVKKLESNGKATTFFFSFRPTLQVWLS